MSDFVEEEQYDWSDITPIPQDDGPDPVVRIAYAPECMNSLTSYFAYLS